LNVHLFPTEFSTIFVDYNRTCYAFSANTLKVIHFPSSEINTVNQLTTPPTQLVVFTKLRNDEITVECFQSEFPVRRRIKVDILRNEN